MFRALEQSDLPVVLGCVSVVAVTFVAINMLVDLAYGWLDPRVKLSSASDQSTTWKSLKYRLVR